MVVTGLVFTELLFRELVFTGFVFGGLAFADATGAGVAGTGRETGGLVWGAGTGGLVASVVIIRAGLFVTGSGGVTASELGLALKPRPERTRRRSSDPASQLPA